MTRHRLESFLKNEAVKVIRCEVPNHFDDFVLFLFYAMTIVYFFIYQMQALYDKPVNITLSENLKC